MSNFVQIGALWKPNGQTKAVLSGKLGNANLFIFKNEYKKESKHPDYVVCVAAPQKKENSGGFDNRQTGEDDIPF